MPRKTMHSQETKDKISKALSKKIELLAIMNMITSLKKIVNGTITKIIC